MLNDLRYAIRTLRQNPGFALTAIVSIALGIGATAAVFSYADGLVLRPLSVPNPSQVVKLSARTPSGTYGDMSYRDFVDYRDKLQSFDGLVAYSLTPFGFARDSKAQSQMKYGYLVSGNLLRVMGTEPQLGRGFRPEEDQVPGRDAVMVLAHDFWKNEFASDPSVIGRRVRVDGLDFTVIGVAPESFTGMDLFIRPAFFLPAMMGPAMLGSNNDLLTNRSNREFTVKGRLKPGVSMQAADAEASALAKSIEQSYPATNRAFGAALRTEMQARLDNDPVTPMMVAVLFAIVVVALLIACANVANLTLSRGRARAREIAVRLAIGASRGRLIRQLMAESLVIAVAGGALALLVAQFGVDVVSKLPQAGDIPIQTNIQLNARVLWFTLLVSLATAILFGLVPALQSSRSDLVPALKAGPADQNRKRFFGRNALVTVQIAGSVVLLVAASQLFRGFGYLLSHSPGFRIDHRLGMSFDPTLIRYTSEQTGQFYKNLIQRVREVPGVKSATLSSVIPMNNWGNEAVIPEGYQFPRGQESASALASTVDDHYFQTLGISLLHGRAFQSSDRADSPRVAIVNELFAKHYLGQNPIGKRIRLNHPGSPWIEIVGVTPTIKYVQMFEPPLDYVYLPFSQNPRSQMALIAEAYGDPAALAAPLREMIRSIDANVPVFGVRTMADVIDQRAVRLMHFLDGLVASIGLLGLGLALVGLYAVVAYRVARRTREIGIRMALGADRSQVMQLILKQAATMGLTGVGIGVVLSLAGSRALSASIMATPAFDPVLITLVPLGLLLTTVLAAAIPARRATRIDPMVALRQD
jgi:macrolide transport system ATP-binding/permease protein